MLNITLIRKLATFKVKYELRHYVPVNTRTSRQRKTRTSFAEDDDSRFSLVDLLVEDSVIPVIQLEFFNRGLEGKRKNLY